MDTTVFKTICEMLEQRGYEVDDSEENFTATCGTKRVVVFYNDAPKVNNERIQEYITKMRNLSINHAIVVYQDSITPVAQKIVTELQGMRMELFEAKTLRYNITKHRLVPKHTPLTKTETRTFKEKYGVKIPVLLTTDPVARFYDFQKGDVIRVERHNGFVCFRIVK
jgi:DNA-directed RNA polymerase I, II, and III subunit RPABC1